MKSPAVLSRGWLCEVQGSVPIFTVRTRVVKWRCCPLSLPETCCYSSTIIKLNEHGRVGLNSANAPELRISEASSLRKSAPSACINEGLVVLVELPRCLILQRRACYRPDLQSS